MQIRRCGGADKIFFVSVFQIYVKILNKKLNAIKW